ncbi:DUF6896 domain-containing protein [Chryseobacterium sp. G0201]|uniref:DUF6896 domain-containing protein n=1 Tax=Chryseobacterium sp. G0201 TaxID=2487065 RepID=UPI000F4E97EF|nr:hypothetical protein [Chryseobacterium sp. G0201]AZA55412.1 hypothetical protein EG348_21620 [Chryseobacterium sp. G0201]
MREIEKIINIKQIGDLPSDYYILSLPRNKKLILNFNSELEIQRQRIGEELKNKFSNYSIGIHTVDCKISIRKLITDEEIISNQVFFEKCAHDYRELGTKLIHALAVKCEIDLKKEVPYSAFVKYWQEYGQRGRLSDWEYFFHGFHCGFKNINTKQYIEVPIIFGLEFGDLDPYFFSSFIKSTAQYKPLPIEIYEDYADGFRINEIMILLGKFEKIQSDFSSHFGTVIKNRSNKVEFLTYANEEQVSVKSKFNLFKFLRIKK